MKLTDKLKMAAFGLTGVVMVSWIMGGEPIFLGAAPNERIPDFNVKQYSKNCGNPLTKTLAYVCYPTAKFVSYLHNSQVKE